MVLEMPSHSALLQVIEFIVIFESFWLDVSQDWNPGFKSGSDSFGSGG
jgi:hypothetical protein